MGKTGQKRNWKQNLESKEQEDEVGKKRKGVKALQFFLIGTINAQNSLRIGRDEKMKVRNAQNRSQNEQNDDCPD